MIKDIYNFIKQLKKSKIYFTLRSSFDDAISVDVSVPGERWEVDFYSNGSIEIEIFKSNGEIKSESELQELFLKFSD